MSWGWIHRYVGLVVGAWLMLVGLSGSVLVFYKEIDSFLYAKYLRVGHEIANPDVDRLYGTVKAAYPDRVILYWERYGIYNDESYPFVLSKKLPAIPASLDMSGVNPQDAESLQVFIDPDTAHIIGERPYWNWIKQIRSFHTELFVAGTGERIEGVIGAVLLLTTIAGVVLWWRESKKKLRRSLRISPSSPTPKLLRDIHTVSGIYIALFLSFQAFTGFMVADEFPIAAWFNGLVAGSKAPPRIPTAQAVTSAPLLSADEARAIALSVHPVSEVVKFSFPNAFSSLYSIRLFPTDQSKFQHTRQILIDGHSGKIVKSFDPDLQPPFLRLFGSWMIWIHNGQFFGMTGRLTALASGLALTVFFPTGIYIWYRKRKSRLAAERRRKPVGAAVRAA